MKSPVMSLSLIAFGILWLSGCGPARLNESRTWTLAGDEAGKALDLPAQPQQQTIAVEFTSNPDAVSVYLLKAEDAKGEDAILAPNAAKALGKATGAKEGNFSAEVPANTATRVIVRRMGGDKQNEVKIKVTNQKQ